MAVVLGWQVGHRFLQLEASMIAITRPNGETARFNISEFVLAESNGQHHWLRDYCKVNAEGLTSVLSKIKNIGFTFANSHDRHPKVIPILHLYEV